ncbi:MAG TPA: amidohydrolase family protein [Candidatus Dormibacteraeota bacterium]|nr:amidohydrolase family protein [Candidatus Dormibacteraeota bacterium]
MLIDAHSHFMPRALARALEARTAAPRIFRTDGETFIEYGERSVAPLLPVFFEPDLILERMDEAGIDHAVLSVTIPGVDWLDPNEGAEVAQASNEETTAIVVRNPDRFSGLATVPLQAPERATDVLQHAVGLGLKGAMIYSNVAGGHLDDPSLRVFFDSAASLDVPVLLHPTYPLCAPTMRAGGMIEMTGFLFDTTTAALRLVFDGLYERHPDFKFIVPHAGSLIPYFVGRIDHFGRLQKPGSTGDITGLASDHIRKFYVDTVCESAPAVHFCCDFFGVDRIMHGTDHPFWPMTLGPRLVEQLGLSDEDRAKIEHENAERVFRIHVPARKAG